MRYGVVLGGGRSVRMGRAKTEITIAGRTLLQRSVDALLTWADAVIVVAPRVAGLDHDDRVRFTLEDPPFGGPVAGIAAAVELTDHAPESEVLIIAGDLANPGSVVLTLGKAACGPDGTVLRDRDGWPQYLAGRYRLPSILDALHTVDQVQNVSVRRFMRPLEVTQVEAPTEVTQDLDTPGDVERIFGPALR